MYTKEFIHMLRNDKEAIELKKKYKNMYGKIAPVFNFYEYSSYEEYKIKLRQMVKEEEDLNKQLKR